MPVSGSSVISASASSALVGIPAGELDAGGLADHTTSSVAADEVPRSQQSAAGKLDVHAAAVLRETGRLAAAVELHRQLANPPGEDAIDMLLPEGESMIVPRGNVADVETGCGEPRDLSYLPFHKELIEDSALIENLQSACGQTARARAGKVLIGRRSTTATSTPASASSPANISPVGPAPTTTTARSVMTTMIKGRSWSGASQPARVPCLT